MNDARRAAVLVSGGGTNLQALIDASSRGEMPHVALSLVVSSTPGAGALARAEKAGIPVAVVCRKEYPTPEAFDEALCGLLTDNDIYCLVLAGFLPILGTRTLASFRNRVINVHPSLIPQFCGRGMYGLRVHKAVLDSGVKVTGATVHLVNEVTDGGRILMQRAVSVLPEDTPETLQQRVMQKAEWQLLPKALEALCRGDYEQELCNA